MPKLILKIRQNTAGRCKNFQRDLDKTTEKINLEKKFELKAKNFPKKNI